jgi:hypothetical protein
MEVPALKLEQHYRTGHQTIRLNYRYREQVKMQSNNYSPLIYVLIQPVLAPGIDISSQHILQIDFSTPNIQELLNHMSSNWSRDPL